MAVAYLLASRTFFRSKANLKIEGFDNELVIASTVACFVSMFF